MTSPPAASFILLCYRQEDTIAEAVDSLLKQSSEPIEIIISDDASPDGTFSRIEDLVHDYDGPHRIVARRNTENLGVNRHIELAINLAQSDLMIWTSGDDINAPDRAQKTIEAHRKTGAKLLYSDAQTLTHQGAPGSDAYRNALLYRPHSLAQAATSFALYLGATAAWHKDLYRKYGGFPEKRAHEDLILGFRATLEESVHYIPEKLVTYREGIGVSSQLSNRAQSPDNKTRRRAILKGKITVLDQRLRDAKAFGLVADHPVCIAISRLRDRMAMRLSYYERGRLSFMRHPLALVQSLVSEWLRDIRNR